MEALNRHFDHYVVNARLKPATFVVLPLAVTALVWLPDAHHLGGLVITVIATFGVVGFFSSLISNRGNALQDRLFEEWGGAPTTELLRHRSETIDPHTKRRYHERLQELIPGLSMPCSGEERADPEKADERYISAVNFLRELSRDRSAFPLVYLDNVAYGYARNLLLMKPWGIASAVMALVINLVMLSRLFVEANEDLLSVLTLRMLAGAGTTGLALTMLALFVGVVDVVYVQGRAIRYAKSLLSACEKPQ